VLAYIAEHPGASNREIAIGAGSIDEGQLSKLLSRAEFLGLVVDRRSLDTPGAPRQWHLTPQGELVAVEAPTPVEDWSAGANALDAVGPPAAEPAIG
jgi:DNA-binding MarR family transcriptional regulator